MAAAQRKRFQLGIKRAFDVVVSASILVTLSPLFFAYGAGNQAGDQWSNLFDHS